MDERHRTYDKPGKTGLGFVVPITTDIQSLKEVIQPQVLLRLPCYDFTPIASFTLNGFLPKVGSPFSSASDSRGVTGGVYKTRERIHGSELIFHY